MNTTEKKAAMYAQIEQHGNKLNAIFNTGLQPIELCKKLFRIERKAHHATTCLCNTNTLHLLELNRYTGFEVEQATEEQQDAFFNKILNSVYKILGPKAKECVFINYDARGYALKIRPEYIKANNIDIYQDWGSNGILAPDFSNL
jgi:hypothetical protein